MSTTPSALDSTAKFWLFFLGLTVLAGVGLLIHSSALDHVPQKKPEAPMTFNSGPTAQPNDPSLSPTWSPDHALPESIFSPTITPEEKAAKQKALIDAQAEYLRELHAKYPNTPSLATPEQIEEMRKSGRMAQ